jgi:hypothetical protein
MYLFLNIKQTIDILFALFFNKGHGIPSLDLSPNTQTHQALPRQRYLRSACDSIGGFGYSDIYG